MKSPKRIFAIAGVILLAALYIATLVLAFADPTPDKVWFKSGLFLCVLVPVLLYAYILVYKHMRDKRQ